jgi:hypothetical protein
VQDTTTKSWIAALERARAELEGVLRPGDDADAHGRARAGNPVYRCWEQLNLAIEELRRSPPAQRRVELRHILAQIRSDAAGEAPLPAAADRPTPAAAQGDATPLCPPEDGAPDGPPTGLRIPSVYPEEASVTFVVRERVRPTRPSDAAEAPPPPAEPDADEPQDPHDGPGAEARVTIVRRTR